MISIRYYVKLCRKDYVLLACLVGFALIFINSAYAEKKLTCDDVKNLVKKEELKKRILSDAKVFPLKEIAESDTTQENKENERLWKENNSCCEGTCAQELGELFAEILGEEENNDKNLLKVLEFIHRTLEQFENAHFISVRTATYNNFIRTLRENTGNYKRIDKIIGIKTNFWELTKEAKKDHLVVERFSEFEKKIKEAIKKEANYIEDIINKENLEQYIFGDKELPFPAILDEGEIKEAVAINWNEKAGDLGNLLAEIALDIENEPYSPAQSLKYHERLDKVMTLTGKIMGELERAEFLDAYSALYHSFTAKISSDFGKYKGLPKTIQEADISEGGIYWAEGYQEAKVRFPDLTKAIRKGIKEETVLPETDIKDSGNPPLKPGMSKKKSKEVTGYGDNAFFILFILPYLILVVLAIELYLVNKRSRNNFRELKGEVHKMPDIITDRMRIERLKNEAKDLDGNIGELNRELSKEFITDVAINGFENIKTAFAEFEKNVTDTSFSEDDKYFKEEHNKLKNEKINELRTIINGLRKSIEQKNEPYLQSDAPGLSNEIVKGLEKRIEEMQAEFNSLKQDRSIQLKQNTALADGINAIRSDIKTIQENIQKLQSKPEAVSEKEVALSEGAVSSAIIQMEQNILIDKWISFKTENKELAALAIKISQSQEKDFYIQDISSLPRLLSHDEKLVSRCKKILIPLNEYYSPLLILAAINEQQSDSATDPLKTGEPEKIISSLRNWTHLLTSLQDFGKVQQFLDFDLSKWVREYFIEFADTFLCAYQESQNKKHNNFPEEAYRVILRILSTGELEPVEIVLGETMFDKKIHIARSTISQSMTRDGVIVQVFRNGFRVGQEGRMIQKPQVVYNRV